MHDAGDHRCRDNLCTRSRAFNISRLSTALFSTTSEVKKIVSEKLEEVQGTGESLRHKLLVEVSGNDEAWIHKHRFSFDVTKRFRNRCPIPWFVMWYFVVIGLLFTEMQRFLQIYKIRTTDKGTYRSVNRKCRFIEKKYIWHVFLLFFFLLSVMVDVEGVKTTLKKMGIRNIFCEIFRKLLEIYSFHMK